MRWLQVDATFVIFKLSDRQNAVMRHLIFTFIMSAICISCKKDHVNTGEPVEIYLLASYQTLTAKCQVDPSASTLEDEAVIRNQDILEYSKTEYTFKLTDQAIQKVKTFADRTPFAVTVDKQVIYYGFFKPSFSSSSCDHSITMDIDWASGDKIVLRLGYPGQLQGVTIEDQRNNPKLITTLANQGKLR